MGPGRARVEPPHEQQPRTDDDQAGPDEQPTGAREGSSGNNQPRLPQVDVTSGDHARL
jgi:hypothetical protein